MNTHIRNRKGFTPIELITAIAIISILAAVLFSLTRNPGVTRSVKSNSALNKLRSIGQAYVNWSGGTRNIDKGAWASGKTQTTSTSGFAAILANGASLDSGELWFVDADLAAEAITVIPKTVITKTGTTVALSAAWTTAIGQGKPAWNVYSPTLPSLAGSANIPFAWSRGLTTAGTWPAAGPGSTDSIWGVEGGHICYGDGHVAWVKDTSTSGPDYFLKTTDGSASASYKDAIPATAALCTLD